MTYISLYRKWRPQTFEEVIGQEPIVQTLKNAITGNRLTHAYLFSGPRGTGKTSTARILAKALNCGQEPTSHPCGKCDQCLRIREGIFLDVIEIDAASNRGIDEIRDLRERVRYAPVQGRYKVYIIDEVHMLTPEAFNALLKTLEEPPTHTIFVLATTQPERVPLTILSRCQRFDFARIAFSKITEHLRKVVRQEGFKIEEEALNLICRSAEGSIRDAISLLDQLVSFCSGTITQDDVVTLLGTANQNLLFEFAQAMAEKNINKVLKLTNEAVTQGSSLPQVTRDLINHFRHILLMKLGSEEIIELTREHMERLRVQAKHFSLAQLKEIISMLSRAERDMKWHPQARLVLEVTLIEAVSLEIPSHIIEPSPVIKPPLVSKASNPEQSKLLTNEEDLLNKIRENWATILEKVKGKSLGSYVSLHEGEPLEINKDSLVIGFRKGFAFHCDRLADPSNKKAVEEALKEVLSQDISISCQVREKLETKSLKRKKDRLSVDEVADLFEGRKI